MKREAYEIRRSWLQKRQGELKQALGLGHLEIGFQAASQTLEEKHLESAPAAAAGPLGLHCHCISTTCRMLAHPGALL